jgi:hypothetical protein
MRSSQYNCLATKTTCNEPPQLGRFSMKNTRPTAAKDPDWEDPYVPKESHEICLRRLLYALLCPALVVLSSLGFASQFPVYIE